MSIRKSSRIRKAVGSESGFTLVELMVAIVMMSVILITFLVFFKSTLFNYLNLQADAGNMTQLDSQADRVATVARGLTDISSASANDLVAYSYFYPSDMYVSLVHYYLQTSGTTTKLMVDVTPMTANPPTGTLLTNNKKTYTIIDTYYQPAGGSLFTYLDGGGVALGTPITDLQTIKGIQVNLATKLAAGGNQAINVQVSLRNRKTNL